MGISLSSPISTKHTLEEALNGVIIATCEMQGYRVAQEDTHVVKLGLAGKPGQHLIGVFDGHSGAKVSAFLAEEMEARVGALSNPMDQAQLINCLIKADHDYLHLPDAGKDGSACIISTISELEGKKGADRKWNVVVANVGDSRAIVIRADGSFEALSEDHKPENPEEMARILKAGGTVLDNRVDGQLAMSRAMGDSPYKGNTALPVQDQKVIPVAEVKTTTVGTGDMLLLCCDGIVEALQNAQVVAHLLKERSSKATLDAVGLLTSLFDASLVAGSKDNHTSVLMCFTAGEETAERRPGFIAGPFHSYAGDDQFVTAYMKDAAKSGLAGQKLLSLARETEEKKLMPLFVTENSPAQQRLRDFGAAIMQNPEMDQEQKIAAIESLIRGDRFVFPDPSARIAEKPRPAARTHCFTCGTAAPPKTNLKGCGACHAAFYCSVECQKKDWKKHKQVCSGNKKA